MPIRKTTSVRLDSSFFNRDAAVVAQNLIGKVIHVVHQGITLSAQIIETEAYYKHEKASHASLGFTEKRKALFMSPGTIYMYYARGGDSLNISCRGAGNAVLIKSGVPYLHEEQETYSEMIRVMQHRNPHKNKVEPRDPHYLCSGQTLICKSLGLTVKEWDQQQLCERFYIEDCHYQPSRLIQTTRLGISVGRDGHLLYRWVDWNYAAFSTKNPLKSRSPSYLIVERNSLEVQ